MNATALVTTWRSRYGAHESVVHLTVSADGRRAEGRFTGLTRTATRSDPPPPPQDFATEGDVSTTTLTEAEFCRLEAEFAIGLRLRGCRQRPVERSRYGIHPVWFHGPGRGRVVGVAVPVQVLMDD
ncbi:hypothetical protein GCM10020221_06790 [Streptomyces thioluteus]|uniref:Uncharacterized protein n=1 Tax=Streptomyces thioluteus TaxID=66431 RepID=A0ABN3WF11_STRTU